MGKVISWKTSYVPSVLLGLLIAPLSVGQTLQITRPANQSFVVAGQVASITVSADRSVQSIWVMTQSPLPQVQATSSPTQFTLKLPRNITPGVYQIGAVGRNSSGDVESSPVLIDVERQDAPYP